MDTQTKQSGNSGQPLNKILKAAMCSSEPQSSWNYLAAQKMRKSHVTGPAICLRKAGDHFWNYSNSLNRRGYDLPMRAVLMDGRPGAHLRASGSLDRP